MFICVFDVKIYDEIVVVGIVGVIDLGFEVIVYEIGMVF